MKTLEGKVAVITGGTRGLGYAVAEALAGAGASVVVGSRSPEAVDAAVARLRSNGAQATGRACDVGREKDVRALAELAQTAFGGLDIWINNAGLSAPYGPTAHVPTDRFESVLRTNIHGTYYGSRIAVESFLTGRGGKLINLLGRGDTGPVPMQNAYASTKSWIRSFTRALAREYRKDGIGVFMINPGLVVTDMISDVEAVEGFEERLRPLETVTRMWGNPPEVPARRILALAGPATDGKTGMEIRVLTFGRIVAGALREFLHLGRNRPTRRLKVSTVPASLPPRS